MRSSLLFPFLFLCSVTSAQSITLTGEVAIQNSRYKTGIRQYVKDAAVRAPFAKAGTTDKDGRFSLAFSGLLTGSTVRIDIQKPGLEVVNHTDLQSVVIGRTALVEVVMADPAELADAQVRFYNVITTAAEANFERMMRTLRDEQRTLDVRIERNGQDLNDTLTSLGEAMELLAMQRETALQQADDLARTFAYVDLDHASDLYQRAYEQLLHGQADSVLMMLDKSRLDMDYSAARTTKQRGAELIAKANISISQLFDSYQLKADVLRLSLDLRGSLVALDAMRIIQEENADVFGALDRALLLRSLGMTQTRLAHLPAARRSLQESFDLFVQHYGPNHSEVIAAQIALADLLEEEGLLDQSMAMYVAVLEKCEVVFGNDPASSVSPMAGIGNIFIRMGEFDSALVYIRRSLDAEHANGRLGTVDEAKLTNTMALVLHEQGRYEEAMTNYLRARVLFKSLIERGVQGGDLSTLYLNLGSLFDGMGQFDVALLYLDSCLVIEERIYGKEHTLPAGTNGIIAEVRSHQGDEQGALDIYMATLATYQRLLSADHNMIGATHGNIAVILDNLGRRDHAIPHYDEALRIYKVSLAPDHPDVATVLANKAFTLGALGDGKAAMGLHREALRMRIATYGEMYDAVSDSYSYIALEWKRAGQVDSALFCYTKSLAIGTEVLGVDHLNNGYIHENLAKCHLIAGDTAAAVIHAERAVSIISDALDGSNPMVASTKAVLAECYRAVGRQDEAFALATGSYTIQPSVHNAWLLYLLANDRGDAEAELDHLVQCMEQVGNSGLDAPVDLNVVRATFVRSATAAGRHDLIERFPDAR